MTTDSSRGLLIAILAVASVNLVVSVLQIGMLLQKPSTSTQASTPQGLPTKFTEAELAGIARRVTEPFNRRDIDALYANLDDVAKNQLPRHKFADQLKEIDSFIGKVDSAAYAGFQKLPGQAGLDVYQLNYVVKLSGGRFNTGMMLINVIDRPQAAGIVGFFINGRSQ